MKQLPQRVSACQGDFRDAFDGEDRRIGQLRRFWDFNAFDDLQWCLIGDASWAKVFDNPFETWDLFGDGLFHELSTGMQVGATIGSPRAPDPAFGLTEDVGFLFLVTRFGGG